MTVRNRLDLDKLVLDYMIQGRRIRILPMNPKVKPKTFLNRSNRGAKDRTLRWQGYAKATCG